MNRMMTIMILMLVLMGFQTQYTDAQINTNNPSASGILGQVDFESRTSGSGADKLNGPNGVAIDPVSGKLFVADRGNHRVLRWGSQEALENGSPAEAVLGQADFDGTGSGIGADRFNSPIGVHVDSDGSLWVGDFSNNRVLRFDNAAELESGAAASGVLGQPDFTTNAAVISAEGMRGPVGVYSDATGTLWVTEFNSHRVTRFDNAAAKANGAAADGVIGQQDFETGSSGLAADKLANPNSLFVDYEGRLWVSEFANRRVTRFDNAATKPNGAPADGVLGQPDFETNTSNLTRDGFTALRFVAGDNNGRIYVIQENSHRIAVFDNAASLANGPEADYIWGQEDFTSNANPNPPTASSFNVPRAMFVDNATGIVWVADWSNNRVLRFGGPMPNPPLVIQDTPPADGVLGQTDFVTKSNGQGADKFRGPNGVAVDPLTGKVFVVDRGNHRILRWSSESAMDNGSSAEAVIGQPDFETVSSGLSVDKFSNPIGAHVDHEGRLWVGDFSNNRVVWFDDASAIQSGAPADGVLGQPDFDTNASTVNAQGIRGPVGVFVDSNGSLWISEFNSHRVTRYDNAAEKENGAPADGVYGQPDFETGSSGLAADKMASPNSVFVDNDGRLWVCETGNRRVTRFDDAASKPIGAPADGVLGQPDFTTNANNLTRDGFTSLRFVTGDDEGRIYVIQENSHRIVIFEDAANLPNGPEADYIWGQEDFTSNANPDPPTITSYNTPRAIFVDNQTGKIWVADWANNRVLRYDLAATDQKQIAILSPSSGDEWAQESNQNITWTSANIEDIIIEFSSNEGTDWTVLDTVPALSGSYEWFINEDETTTAQVRISDAADTTILSISGVFSIIAPVFDVTLISPNGYQVWEAGTRKKVLFETTNVDQVDIEFSTDNGLSWETLAVEYDATSGSYDWDVSEVISNECLIRVVSSTEENFSDVSEVTFSIEEVNEDAIQDFVFFADSPTPEFYDFSFGFVNAPSILQLVNNVKFPVTPQYGYKGNYSLLLNWLSATNGDWGMAAAGNGWPGRDFTNKDTLSFRMFTEQPIADFALPLIYLEDLSNRKSDRLKLGDYIDGLEANTWYEVKIPIEDFLNNPGQADMTRIKTIFWGQDQADTEEHTVYLDDIRATGGRVISGDSSNVFVVIGSSTAAGTGATVADSSWVGRFRNYVQELDTNAVVINLAVGGYTTYDVMPSSFVPPSGRPAPKTNNNITYALSFKPTAIIINMPSNDAARGFTIAEQVSNFKVFADEAAQDTVPLWVTTTQPRNLSDPNGRADLIEMRDSILMLFGSKGVNIFDELAEEDGGLKSSYDIGDGIHVNNAGHKYIYDQIVGAGVLDSLITTSIKEGPKGSNGNIIDAIFPNPFSDFARIQYTLIETANVYIRIVDALGKEVAVLHQGSLQPGAYESTWHPQGREPGLYFCTIMIQGSRTEMDTKKLLYSK